MKEVKTIKQVATFLNKDEKTIQYYIRKLWPEKMRHGRVTYLSEAEVLVLIERMKAFEASSIEEESLKSLSLSGSKVEPDRLKTDAIKKDQDATLLPLAQDLVKQNTIIAEQNRLITKLVTQSSDALPDNGAGLVKLMSKLRYRFQYSEIVLALQGYNPDKYK